MDGAADTATAHMRSDLMIEGIFELDLKVTWPASLFEQRRHCGLEGMGVIGDVCMNAEEWTGLENFISTSHHSNNLRYASHAGCGTLLKEALELPGGGKATDLAQSFELYTA